MQTAKFSHSGNAGDVLASLPAMKTFYQQTGRKIVLHLIKDIEAFYYEGAVHPVKNSENRPVMLNSKMIEMLRPLLMAQPCIEDVVEVSEDVPDSIRLHMIRETNVGMPALCINRWYFYAFPDLACDLSKPWLEIPDTDKDLAKGKIIITRTERYRNNANYSFLKPYEDDLIFSGTQREWNQFCMEFGLNVKKLIVNSFMDIAQAIKQSKFHITNQTAANQISAGLMHPSILEVCDFAPNCIPVGKDRYDFLAQPALEYYFHKLNGTLKPHVEEMQVKHKQQIPS